MTKCKNCGHLIEKDNYGEWKHRVDYSAVHTPFSSIPSKCRIGKYDDKCDCENPVPEGK